MSKDSAAIRDQLGNDPDITFILNSNYNETYGMEEGPAIISATTLGHSWICGSDTNGIVGVNLGTEDGFQQVVGSAGQVQGVVRVVNPNNTFHEHFRYNDFEDTGLTTANWDTSNYEISFTAAEIVQTLSLFLNIINITNARLDITGTGLANLTLQLSSDGGSNFETVTNGTLHTFTNVGQDLRFKATSSGVATITEITIRYNI